jgi:hypothetical protein
LLLTFRKNFFSFIEAGSMSSRADIASFKSCVWCNEVPERENMARRIEMALNFCGRIVLALILFFTAPAFASEGGGHADPVAPVLLALVVILVAAKLGSEIFERLGQPAVQGELLGGVGLGNLIQLNPAWNFFEPLRVANIQEHWALVIDSLARIGVIILLLEVGLESTVQGMMKVGASALFVAVLGVIVPFILGFGVSGFSSKSCRPSLRLLSPPASV